MKISLSDYIPDYKFIVNPRILELTYQPNNIVARDPYINILAKKVFSRPLKKFIPDNIFVYGSHGIAKTLVISKLGRSMEEETNSRTRFVHIHCEKDNTTPKVLKKILFSLGVNVHEFGVSSSYYYNKLYKHADNNLDFLILALDEVDELIKMSGDELILNLLRAREQNEINYCNITIVCIANDPHIMEKIRSKVRTMLPKENWILFRDYNAGELTEILETRAEEGLKTKNIEKGVYSKIGGIVRQEGGDARRGISYLKNLVYYCEENNFDKIRTKHVDEIKNMVERDILEEELGGYNEQKQFFLYSIGILQKDDEMVRFKECYREYKRIMNEVKMPVITERQIFRYLEPFRKKQFIEYEERREKGKPIYIRLVDGEIILEILKDKLKLYLR